MVLNTQDKDGVLILLILRKKQFIVCQFCGGKGHYYFQCNTKKALDREIRSQNCKIAWGFHKSKVFKVIIEARAKEKQEYLNKRNADQAMLT